MDRKAGGEGQFGPIYLTQPDIKMKKTYSIFTVLIGAALMLVGSTSAIADEWHHHGNGIYSKITHIRNLDHRAEYRVDFLNRGNTSVEVRYHVTSEIYFDPRAVPYDRATTVTPGRNFPQIYHFDRDDRVGVWLEVVR